MASSSPFFLFTALHLLFGSSMAADSKVHVELYYETLCRDSADFIVNELDNIIGNGLISVVDLDMIPFGNAKVISNGTIICEHGVDECLVNIIQACAISTWPNVHLHFDFIKCVESSFLNGCLHDKWTECLPEELDSRPVLECYQNGTGHQLHLKNGKRTDSLKPPHKYVPWVVIDGEPLYNKYNDFQAVVCKTYKGSNLPKVCDELRLNIFKKKKQSKSVSYRSKISLPDAVKMEVVN